MSYYTRDPYNQPEAFGLEILGTIEDDIEYEFNMLVVWRHQETGEMYWATDAGCSCPCPFEDYTQLSDLNAITPGNWREFEQGVKEFSESVRYRNDQAAVKAVSLLARVHFLLRNRG